MEVLELVARKQVVTRSELLRVADQETIQRMVDSGFIRPINPIGSTTYVITQKGVRRLESPEDGKI